MGKGTKPRICEMLGVKQGQEWKVKRDGEGYDTTYRISMSGNMQRKSVSGKWLPTDTYVQDLVAAINHPEDIVRKPHWTKEDIEDAKAVRRIWPDVNSVEKSLERARTGWMLSLFRENDPWFCTRTDAFPSIKPGERIGIDEILEADNGI